MGIRQFVGVAEPEVEMNECRFLFLWTLGIVMYGVGDLLTTFAIISGFPHVVESNPLLARSVALVGYHGIVVLKLVVFFAALGISVYASRVWGDKLLHYFPPIAIAVVGAFTTAFNVRLIIG